jgi:enolase
MIPEEITARKILDSRGQATIEVTVKSLGKKCEASAPSGKSRGKYEVEPFSSKGIEFSVSFLNALGRKIIDDKINLEKFDDLGKIEDIAFMLDKTKDLSFMGGNALFALESALLKCLAAVNGRELWQFLAEEEGYSLKNLKMPKPLGNCIGGGMHVSASLQKKKADYQEFLILPGAMHFFDSYFINLQAYKKAKAILAKKDSLWKGTLTDENALASTLENEQILELLKEVSAGIKGQFGIELELGIDMAASSMCQVDYIYKNPPKKLSKERQIEYILDLVRKFNLSYIEDPLKEEDFEGFSRLLKDARKLNPLILICGDDLTATHAERLDRAIKEKSVNAVIVKPNQCGSLLKTKEFFDKAKKAGIVPVISHRSGETSDNTIAHLAVGWQAPIIKTGILGKERFAKLHELMRIEREIAKQR